jgi:ceramide glucosyltransferase
VIRVLLFCAVVGLISSTVYLILAIAAARRFWIACRKQVEDGVSFPPVTVLKPLYGLEPQLESNLESFFLQDYPKFELIFGARDASDPALNVVEALRQKYPHIKSRVVFSGEREYPNAKVFSLEKMMPSIRGHRCNVTFRRAANFAGSLISTQTVLPAAPEKVSSPRCSEVE